MLAVSTHRWHAALWARLRCFRWQDVMALDNEARMNTPGKAVGNWAWRMGDASVWTTLKASAARLYSMNKLYDWYGCRGGTGCC